MLHPPTSTLGSVDGFCTDAVTGSEPDGVQPDGAGGSDGGLACLHRQFSIKPHGAHIHRRPASFRVRSSFSSTSDMLRLCTSATIA